MVAPLAGAATHPPLARGWAKVIGRLVRELAGNGGLLDPEAAGDPADEALHLELLTLFEPLVELAQEPGQGAALVGVVDDDEAARLDVVAGGEEAVEARLAVDDGGVEVRAFLGSGLPCNANPSEQPSRASRSSLALPHLSMRGTTQAASFTPRHLRLTPPSSRPQRCHRARRPAAPRRSSPSSGTRGHPARAGRPRCR